MSAFLRKYGTGTGADVIIPMIKRGVVDFAATGDWTPASGDVKVSLDGGAESNIGTLPVINGTYGWKFVFSDAELQAKSIRVTIVDSATKVVEDQCFIIETYGNASAMYQADLSAANLPANVVQLSGDSTAADNAEAFFDGTGYAGTNNVIPTVTTTTNLTNAPTAGDFTATMKTSITTAATAATPSVTVSDKTGFSLSSAGIQAIWDALTSALTTVGSIGKLLVDRIDAAISSRSSHSAADAANAVRDVSNASPAAGSLGENVKNALEDTNELQTDWANGGRLDVILDARASQTSVDDIPTNAELAAAITTGLTTALTEGYRGTGATGSVRDLLYELLANITEFTISGTTKTAKKLDGSTTAKTYTLDDGTSPTGITEAT